MKNIILVLSLLFSVSGFGLTSKDFYDYYRSFNNTTAASKICQYYATDIIYDTRREKCDIPRWYLVGLNNSKASKVCSSVFGVAYNKSLEICSVSKEKLLSAKDRCINYGISCPRILPAGAQPKACDSFKNYSFFQKKCDPLSAERVTSGGHLLIGATLIKELFSRSADKDTCWQWSTNLGGSTHIVNAYASSCGATKTLCNQHCSEKLCEPYKHRESLLLQEIINYNNAQTALNLCSERTGTSNFDLLRKQAVERISNPGSTGLLGNIRRTNARLANNMSKFKGEIISSQDVQKIGEEGVEEENTEQDNKLLSKINKFQQNKAHVGKAFDELNQKIADRMNKGKANKEDRKPDAITSASNDNSLANKKKSNKYLVASSNDSFLTQKDIFKTVSNAYYKMCQTDSCYGIVKK